MKTVKKKKIDLDKLKTWKSICKAKGIDPIKSLPFQNRSTEEGVNDTEEGVNAFFKLSTIREVLNNGEDADWSSGEAKWFPWPNVVADKKKPSGFGLSYYDYGRTHSFTSVGSRLSFNRREKARHAFTYFQPVYEKFMLITKEKK